jgi:hypothetical protein
MPWLILLYAGNGQYLYAMNFINGRKVSLISR